MTADILTRLGRRIAEARRERGKTQAQLAEIVGVHANTVARWERGELSLSALHLALVERSLGLSAGYLLA